MELSLGMSERGGGGGGGRFSPNPRIVLASCLLFLVTWYGYFYSGIQGYICCNFIENPNN
jgi:hypothetical protein